MSPDVLLAPVSQRIGELISEILAIRSIEAFAHVTTAEMMLMQICHLFISLIGGHKMQWIVSFNNNLPLAVASLNNVN